MHEFIPLHHVILLKALLCSYELNTCLEFAIYFAYAFERSHKRTLQLLNSNLFTHRKILMLLREATSETYGPRVFFIILIFQYLVISFAFLLCFYFTLHLYHKNTKNIILSYLSDLTLVSDRVGIDNPLSRWLRGFICFV